MVFEHLALNVEKPREMAAWYAEMCGMRIVRSVDDPPYVHFLADATGRVLLEIYRNTADEVPDYFSQNPLRVHIAFAVAEVQGEKQRLLDAGATVAKEERLDDGTEVVTLRDPWGLPLQLVKRGTPFGDTAS